MNPAIFNSSFSTKAQSRTSDSQSYTNSNPGHHSTLSLSMITPAKNPSNKDFCRICSCSFTLINKKLMCKGCGEPMCYIHSSLLDRYNLERICDICMQDILKKQAEEEIAEIKQTYIGELSFSTLEREEKTRLINKALGRLRKLRIEKKESEDKFKKEKETLLKILKNNEDEISDIGGKILEIRSLLLEQQEIENVERERFQMAQAEEEIKLAKLKRQEQISVDIENKESNLAGEVVKYLDLKTLQKNICIVCNNALAAEFSEFKEIHSGRKTKAQDEMSRQICSCSIS